MSSPSWAATILALWLSAFPLCVHSYTWSFEQTPAQCSDLTITISGNDGSPPYRALIALSGPTPWVNKTEVRKNFEVNFPPSANKVTFKMPYPANSKFVAVVSDATGFASGGTGVATEVAESSDTSCIDFSDPKPLNSFYFFMDPPTEIVQCRLTRFSWKATDVQGEVKVLGVIPGGQSLVIPQNTLGLVGGQVGFDWKVPLRAFTTFIIIVGDDRGVGTGGSVENLVTEEPYFDTSCLDAHSPSSTPGSPAGALPTNSQYGESKFRVLNLGAVVAGIVGGVAFIIVLSVLLWCWRRSKHERSTRVIQLDQERIQMPTGSQIHHLQYYNPQPLVLPPPFTSHVGFENSYPIGHEAGSSGLSDWRSTISFPNTTPHAIHSSISSAGDTYATSPISSTSQRAGFVLGQGQSSGSITNLVQHHNAGPSQPKPAVEDIVELPPAYPLSKGTIQAPGVQHKPDRRSELVLHSGESPVTS